MLGDFIKTYFINPIVHGTGYNVYNTALYATVLIIAVFLTYKLLRKMRIKIDRNFLLGVSPFVALGGVLRALQDAFSISYLFVTPLIYFVIFAAALFLLIISKSAEKVFKKEYYKIWLFSGALLCILGVSYMPFANFQAFEFTSFIFIGWAALLLAIKRLSKKVKPLDSFMSLENISLILVHMFDATTTFVALQFFSYWEQHVVTSFAINVFGPAAIFFIKLPVVILALYLIDRELYKKKDIEKRNIIKLAILVLGLAPGLRNLLRLIMGV